MRLIHHPSELPSPPDRVCVAIGVFDGVHLGHQQVIRQAIVDARQRQAAAVVITFDRHPRDILTPGKAPPLIYALPQKLKVLEALGPDILYLIRFDRAFSEIPAEQFIEQLTSDLKSIYSVCVGSAFTFGHRRGGNVALLRELGRRYHFIVHGLSAVSLDGQIVSSTLIRGLIQQGDLDQASQMLGRPYSTFGKVARGDALGRSIGIPTANVDCAGLVLPPNGVYAVHALVDNQSHPAVVNIGVRPTVSAGQERRVEAHLLDFSGDLYGKELEIVFVQKIRDERKFKSLEDLKLQIEADILESREAF